jgi:stalled ribosome rescue protein Dom34
MLAATVDRIVDLAGSDGWIVLGGIRRVVVRLASDLAAVAPNRVLEMPALDVHASEAKIAHAARVGASTLRAAFDARRVAEIVEEAGANGLGVIGAIDTRHALEQASVRELYITRRYLEEYAADAEDEVRLALDQNASVEEVSGAAAEDLDRSGGIAASLRFRAPPLEASPVAGIETSAAN